MDSIIQKIKSAYPDMGYAEKKIADYILKSTNEIASLSIVEFAKNCSCGSATIVRFSRRLGLSGYQELKIAVASELNSASKIDSTILKTDSCYDIFRKRVVDIFETLKSTETTLDEQHMNLAAQRIMEADRIVVFGLGNSASIATDVAHKFLRLGLNAQASSDNHMQAIIASHLSGNCVAIGISHSGASKDIVEALKLAKICGATTVCVTKHSQSPLVEVSDFPLFTMSDETSHSILALSSRIATLAIFDAIYHYIVTNSEKTVVQAIYNTEYSLKEKKY